jgi:hypothetical protein
MVHDDVVHASLGEALVTDAQAIQSIGGSRGAGTDPEEPDDDVVRTDHQARSPIARSVPQRYPSARCGLAGDGDVGMPDDEARVQNDRAPRAKNHRSGTPGIDA